MSTELPEPLTPKAFYFDYLGWCACGNPEEALIFMQEVLELLHARQHGDDRKTIIEVLRKKLGEELHPGLYWSYLYMLDSEGLIEHGFNISGSWLTEKGRAVLAMLEAHDDFDSLNDDEPARTRPDAPPNETTGGFLFIGDEEKGADEIARDLGLKRMDEQ